MWEICKQNCALWNKQMTEFEKIERLLEADNSYFPEVFGRNYEKYEPFIHKELISQLEKEGLILSEKIGKDEKRYKYKNANVSHCMKKAGNILEMYEYMLINEIGEEESAICDIDVGVSVDWDGDGDDGRYETTNEIDLIVMKKHIPVFVSCKNGEVNKEALYELETVAQHFGGEYTKKILICSYISNDENKKEYLLQRARDMKIDVLHSVHNLTREKFKEELKKRVI